MPELPEVETIVKGLRRHILDLRIKAAKVYFSSPAFVEDWAHNEGKMVREGETLVVPLYRQSEEAPVATPQPVEVAVVEIPSWQVWWALFFEREPLMNQ